MSAPSAPLVNSDFGNGFFPWMGVTLVIVFTTLSVLCALLAASALSELFARKPATTSSGVDAHGAAVAMLSTATRENQTRSLDAVRKAERGTKLRRRLAVGTFMGLVLPFLWCAGPVALRSSPVARGHWACRESPLPLVARWRAHLCHS
jgi:hypothetical protein